MHKAYDRVKWFFLKEILLRLGFNANWVEFLKNCVSSVSYKVRFNETETTQLSLQEGLSGRPLSPYLFLLCTGGLTALLNHAESNG